jgi:CRISPR system Cascade subunit CasC
MKNRFLQLHFLTAYPPSNLNRDDLGRPKTAVVGGANRLRISSQCLKRTWRTSDVFESRLEGAIGTRTKMIGQEIHEKLIASGIGEKDATKWATLIVEQFGKVAKEKDESDESKPEKSKKHAKLEQLVHFSPQEEMGIYSLAEAVALRKSEPTKDELGSLKRRDIKAADIALFGRMMADTPEYNMEAAAQVAHAITTHRVSIEDDFFSAVDELNKGIEDRGSGHIGTHEFGSGLFYTYVCINRELLIKNLQGDVALAQTTIDAFVRAASTVSPSGKQNSFAAHGCALYILAELGNQQPRSLSNAFFKPVNLQNQNVLEDSCNKMNAVSENLAKVYGPGCEKNWTVNVDEGKGTIAELVAFAIGE